MEYKTPLTGACYAAVSSAAVQFPGCDLPRDPDTRRAPIIFIYTFLYVHYRVEEKARDRSARRSRTEAHKAASCGNEDASYRRLISTHGGHVAGVAVFPETRTRGRGTSYKARGEARPGAPGRMPESIRRRREISRYFDVQSGCVKPAALRAKRILCGAFRTTGMVNRRDARKKFCHGEARKRNPCACARARARVRGIYRDVIIEVIRVMLL